jgi:hypothetical protein
VFELPGLTIRAESQVRIDETDKGVQVSETHSTRTRSIASTPAMRVAHPAGRRVFGLSLVLAAVLCVVGVAPAVAAPKYVHRVVAPSPGVSGSGTLEGQFGPNAPRDMAVNRSAVDDGAVGPSGDSVDGYVYVADSDNHRVQVFDSDGVFQFMFGAGVENGAPVGQVCDRIETPCRAGVEGSVGGAFREPQGVVVDQDTGNVFVRERTNEQNQAHDRGNMRVQEFTANGVFVRAWGWDVVQEGTVNDTATDQFETCRVAVDCQRGSSGSGLGQFLVGHPGLGYGGGIDLHAPSGDVVVADPAAGRIQRFDVPANSADPVVPVSVCPGITGFWFSNATVAVDDGGIVYAPGGVQGADTVQRCDLSGPSLMTPITISSIVSDGPKADVVGLDLDPTSGNLLVALNHFEPGQPLYSPVVELANPGGAVGSITHADTHVPGTGLEWNGLSIDPDSGALYLASNRLLLEANDGPATPPTSALFQPYSDVTPESATVNVAVDAGQRLGATYQIQIARSSDPGEFKTVASGTVERGAGAVPVAVPLSNLLPGTLYVVRVASRFQYGNPETFTDAPVLLTRSRRPSVNAVGATAVGGTTVRLVGRVNPHGTQTRYRFEWGQNGFQHVTPVPDGLVGSGYGSEFVSQVVSGLTSNTKYQYRLVATSDSLGEAPVDATHTVTTRPETSSETGRAYELVSPADKSGGVGVGEWYRGPASLAPAGVAAYSGERFAALGSFGSVLAEGGFAYGNDWSFADRLDSRRGWVGRSPVVRPSNGPAFASFVLMQASSEDLSQLLVSSNGTLLQFPELTAPGWKLEWDLPYWVSWGAADVAPRWELFGPNDKALINASVVGPLWRVLLSDDGSRAVGLTSMAQNGVAAVRGMAGTGDPTRLGFNDLVAGRSIYLANTSGEPSDVFATGPRALVNVCSGSGAGRTVLPAIDALGDLAAVACPAALTGRDNRLTSDHGASLQGDATSAAAIVPPEDVVTTNGRRVFFLSPDPAATGVPDGVNSFCASTGETCPAQLFVRQENNDGSFTTRWVSRSKVPGQDATLTGAVRFEGATRDGDKVLFRTNSPLTADDPNGTGALPPPGGVKVGTASNGSWDLYLYDFPDDPSSDPGAGSLTRVSAGPEAGGDCNSPYTGGGSQNTTAAMRLMSSDATRVYFACTKPLAGAATTVDSVTTPAAGSSPSTETNLYVYDANLPDHGDRWRFLARLPRSTSGGMDVCASTGYSPRSPFDAEAQRPQFQMLSSVSNCLRGTSDGKFVTFFTSGSLTADDPTATPTGDLYAFEADSARLLRISASQDGVGGTYLCAPQGGSTAQCHADDGVDGQGTHVKAGPANAMLGVATDPIVPGDHVAFFQSAVRLVAEDTDESYDVYQWRNGELSLLTPGTADHALYLGNDRSGRNVFVASRDRLSWQDFDSVGDVYSARFEGGIQQPAPAPVCQVLANLCQPAGTVQAPVIPESAESGGGGNVDNGPEMAPPVLAVVPIRKAALRVAARSGVLRLAVRVTRVPVRLRAVASASVSVRGRRAKRRVATVSATAKRAGVTTLTLRLSRAARHELRRRGRLDVSIRVGGDGQSQGSVKLTLKRAGR